jgi:DNA-binding MarR family transcriptional regulator
MAHDVTSKAREIAANCACMKARQTSRVLTRIYDEHLRPLGLQTSQLTVLIAIGNFSERGAPFGRLADAIGMERSTLTRNLAPLERDGLLRVEVDPEDARQRVVVLTKDGTRMIERAYPLWQKAQAEVATELRTHLERAVRALPSATTPETSARSTRRT